MGEDEGGNWEGAYAGLEDKPWDELLALIKDRLAASDDAVAGKERRSDARLQKKLEVIRLALAGKGGEPGERQELNTASLLEVIDLVSRMSDMIESYRGQSREWRAFIKVLERKLEREGALEGGDPNEQRRLREAIDKLKTKLGE